MTRLEAAGVKKVVHILVVHLRARIIRNVRSVPCSALPGCRRWLRSTTGMEEWREGKREVASLEVRHVGDVGPVRLLSGRVRQARKHLLNDKRHDPPLGAGGVEHTLHEISLSRARLAVCEDGAVAALHQACVDITRVGSE